jgi:S1-C subfamily serine protease
LILDVNTCATVREVVADSIAHRAGIKAGDQIVRFDDQPIISLADVQWVLHLKPNTAISLPVTLLRDGKSTTLSLNLADDWKAMGDISWRASSWELRRLVLGGMVLKELDKSERLKLGISDGSMALRIGHVGQYAPHNRAKLAGLQKEDVVVSVLGKKNLTREVDIIRFLLDQRQTTQQIPIEVLRAGKPISFELK